MPFARFRHSFDRLLTGPFSLKRNSGVIKTGKLSQEHLKVISEPLKPKGHYDLKF